MRMLAVHSLSAYSHPVLLRVGLTAPPVKDIEAGAWRNAGHDLTQARTAQPARAARKTAIGMPARLRKGSTMQRYQGSTRGQFGQCGKGLFILP